MYKNPYETTPCSAYELKDIVAALQIALVDGQLLGLQTDKVGSHPGVFEVPPYCKAVNPFTQVIHFDHFGKSVYVVDTRAFLRERREGGVQVSNVSEHEAAALRALTTKAWNEIGSGAFQAMAELPARVFVRLVSEAVSRRLALSPADQQTVIAVTAYYFFSLFTDEVWDEQGLYRLGGRIARCSLVPADRAIQILEKLAQHDGGSVTLQPAKSIDDLIRAMQTACESPRLSTLNVGLLYAATGGVWYGAAAREHVAVALEYPPAWMTLIYLALTDRTYHGSQLQKLVLAADKGALGSDFAKNLIALLRS